jgi:hypothetical protein
LVLKDSSLTHFNRSTKKVGHTKRYTLDSKISILTLPLHTSLSLTIMLI